MEHFTEAEDTRLQAMLGAFLREHTTTEARVAAVQGALDSAMGRMLRAELGEWIVRLVPVESLAPEVYARWRPLVRDAMLFVVSHLSPARLATKVVEQIELPADSRSEMRLLQLIARVPGLQKIGQVLARNRNLPAPLRRALSELENGISDVSPAEVRGIISRQLRAAMRAHEVELEPGILSEASVSAVVAFTWRNPRNARRERGVFKVLKPYIPGCYAEDMKILHDLTGYLARKYRAGKIKLAGLAETLTEIRLLLEREVDFRREQATLVKARHVYRSVTGVRIPEPIEALSTDTITALSHEDGVKVTDAFANSAAARERVAQRLAEALVAVPALAIEENVVFHADPHAGNILYDKKRGDLVILDWALTEHLTRSQRRNVVMLVLGMGLRDHEIVCGAVRRLLQHRPAPGGAQDRLIRHHVAEYLDGLALRHTPAAMDAMRLLDRIALEGLRFPAALVMFRKASFTLDGVLEDVAGRDIGTDSVLARYALVHCVGTGAALWWLLRPRDWAALEWSALTFAARLGRRALLGSWMWIPAMLRPRPAEG